MFRQQQGAPASLVVDAQTDVAALLGVAMISSTTLLDQNAITTWLGSWSATDGQAFLNGVAAVLTCLLSC